MNDSYYHSRSNSKGHDSNEDNISHQMSIDDLNASKLKIKTVPKLASQTCRGQVLLQPIITPVPYNQKHTSLNKQTLQEFGLTKMKPLYNHRFNHICQNIQLASLYKV
jgi:hypothetical protein